MERRRFVGREQSTHAAASTLSEISVSEGEGRISSGFVNVIFPYSRPIASVFCATGLQKTSASPRTRAEERESVTIQDTHPLGVNPNVARVVRSCLDFVAVPGSMYWRDALPTQGSGWTVSVSPRTLPSTATGPRTGAPLKRKRGGGELRILQPNARSVVTSFYKTRAEAVSLSGYATDHELIVVACDRGQGSEAKAFNVLPRLGVPRFIREIPDHQSRNLYSLVDENALVDPFLDVDVIPGALIANLETLVSRASTSWDDVQKELEIGSSCDKQYFLETTLQAVEWVKATSITAIAETLLRDALVAVYASFRVAFDAAVERGAVLTSSVPPLHAVGDSQSGSREREVCCGKISFHLHLRLADNFAFANVRELNNFMQHVKRLLMYHSTRRRSNEVEASRSVSSQKCNLDDIPNHRLFVLIRALDFAVYTRWRAFRLPYNCKAQGAQPSAFTEVIRSVLIRAGVPTQTYRVGDVANRVIAPPWVNGELLSLLEAALPRGIDLENALRSFCQNQRYLIPIIPGLTSIHDEELSVLLPSLTASPSSAVGSLKVMRRTSGSTLQPHEVVSLFDLACIQRDQVATMEGPRLQSLTMDNVRSSSGDGDERGNQLPPPRHAEESPKRFIVPRPRDGLRTYINDPGVLEAVAEVFRCLSHHYSTGSSEGVGRGSSGITGANVHVQFTEEVRSFYAQQKVSKYCLRQLRHHQSTYGQLFLTYGSIKFRCYSNDCHDRCRAICWCPGDVSKGLCPPEAVMPVDEKGYPNYARLEQLRAILFPELPKEELFRRYGSSTPLSS